jgi:hypothetical protein
VAMNTLLNMYRAYKRGTAIPGIDRFPGVDIVGAEEAMRAQCREMSRDLFHFLGESGEVPEAHAISTSFFKGDSCWAVQWNDFQRMFRGKGLEMTRLQEMYRNFKRQSDNTAEAPSTPLPVFLHWKLPEKI